MEEEEVPTFNFTVRKTTLDAVIEGVDSYTRYQINVSGFSRRGDGPSAITDGGMINKKLFQLFECKAFPDSRPLFLILIDSKPHL